jgi:hypothetical protein
VDQIRHSKLTDLFTCESLPGVDDAFTQRILIFVPFVNSVRIKRCNAEAQGILHYPNPFADSNRRRSTGASLQEVISSSVLRQQSHQQSDNKIARQLNSTFYAAISIVLIILLCQLCNANATIANEPEDIGILY